MGSSVGRVSFELVSDFLVLKLTKTEFNVKVPKGA